MMWKNIEMIHFNEFVWSNSHMFFNTILVKQKEWNISHQWEKQFSQNSLSKKQKSHKTVSLCESIHTLKNLKNPKTKILKESIFSKTCNYEISTWIVILILVESLNYTDYKLKFWHLINKQNRCFNI